MIFNSVRVRDSQEISIGSGAVLDHSANSDLEEVPDIPDPVTPVDPESKPETPSTGRMLANGKAITEANVTEILNQLQTRYPRTTSFGSGYAGLGSGRVAAKNCIAQVTKNYTANNTKLGTTGVISTAAGCGGWAAFVADEIFGQTGVTWKKTSIANARPGDLMIILDDAGYLQKQLAAW